MPITTLQNGIKISVPESVKKLDNKKAPADAEDSTSCVCMIVKAEKFSLYYGSKVGVKDITIDVYPCSVTAIIGPSGCGKSTFLRSINRMNDLIPHVHAEGKLIVDGQDVYDKRVNLVNLRQQVGMVFQKPNPFPKSIFDNVAYGPRLQGIKRRSDLQQIVEQSLKASALWEEVKDDLKKSALALSGGQQQRLCIARALATKPRVLLMDEPCSALDPIATGRIEDLIEQLKSNYTIVIVTHNMQQAARVSERAAFFCLGELIEYDMTSKIFSNPTKKQTEDYITGRFG
ncbi:MAG: phosphate ABC transporter ATP-binding protein [Phycisphaerae bacterium]|nr:phosphate ABC transporter ATP-binding protein [Phycisphaerae bacterium]NIR62822.1 phosphate ABC transporter ATP-binding protein [candidate division Zixibacteria bacterium]NIP52713.1 phosphate ABC transporter ATP-binding protein [Phycisphaerae bacterium]NIS51760.1 phosphate ABC transporter ATP-binding protein [Phycisphaerae bacterium]NIU57001.1 phosphate ABC transporter ATP-binding protein [Phycisphaerae bacterium]